MIMNLGGPPGVHSEEPNRPKFVQTSVFKGTQENSTVTQTLHNGTANFPSMAARWLKLELTPWKKNKSALTTLQITE